MSATFRQALRELEAELEAAERTEEEAGRALGLACQIAQRRRQAVTAMREIVAEHEPSEAVDASRRVVDEAAVPSTVAQRAEGVPPGGGPTRRRRSREDIIAVMSTAPSEAWPLQRLVDALAERGWTQHMLKPEAAIEHSASRLVADGRLTRVGPGVYM